MELQDTFSHLHCTWLVPFCITKAPQTRQGTGLCIAELGQQRVPHWEIHCCREALQSHGHICIW